MGHDGQVIHWQWLPLLRGEPFGSYMPRCDLLMKDGTQGVHTESHRNEDWIGEKGRNDK